MPGESSAPNTNSRMAIMSLFVLRGQHPSRGWTTRGAMLAALARPLRLGRLVMADMLLGWHQ